MVRNNVKSKRLLLREKATVDGETLTLKDLYLLRFINKNNLILNFKFEILNFFEKWKVETKLKQQHQQ